MASNKVSPTLSRQVTVVTVAPSPLNAVKFELGVVLVIGILLLLMIMGVVAASALQILLLLGYGVLSAGWIIFRARRVMLRVIGNRERNGEK